MFYIQSFRYEYYNENTYIASDTGKQCFIVDPGCYTEREVNSILKFILANRLIPQAILVTHAHIDHILGVQKLNSLLNVPLYIHPNEYNIFLNMPAIAQKSGYEIEPFSGQVLFLNDGDTLQLNSFSFEILHTPGHTQYSISYYDPNYGILFSGDVLFKGKIGNVNLPGGNYTELLNTIQKKIFLLPDSTKVYSGHGQYTTIGNEKLHNKLISWN